MIEILVTDLDEFELLTVNILLFLFTWCRIWWPRRGQQHSISGRTPGLVPTENLKHGNNMNFFFCELGYDNFDIALKADS